MISNINHPSNGDPNISNWSLESNGQFFLRNCCESDSKLSFWKCQFSGRIINIGGRFCYGFFQPFYATFFGGRMVQFGGRF